MIFIETSIFTEDVKDLLPDDLYAELQKHLALYPDAGDLIQETGGIRKFRWKLPGKGKSGGVRVIYFWRTKADQILMLAIYPKSTKDDLSAAEKKALCKVVERWQ